MSLDHQLQLWNVIGTWFAAVATLAAVCVSLWLAGRADRVRLRVYVGVRLLVAGDGSEPREFAVIMVTNLGDRPVTINAVGWRVGWWPSRRYCLQHFGYPESADYPVELAHAKTATFMLPLASWASDFMNGWVKNRSPMWLATLTAQVHTSVGQTVNTKAEAGLQQELRSKAPPAKG